MELEQSLDAHTMRTIIQLRRLLQHDHGVDIDIEDPHVMENLIDAAREAKDKKAEKLAYELCDRLTELNYRLQGNSCRERLDANFRNPLHEKFVGANPSYVYRGQVVEDARPSTAKRPEPPAKRDKVVIYRGQKIAV